MIGTSAVSAISNTAIPDRFRANQTSLWRTQERCVFRGRRCPNYSGNLLQPRLRLAQARQQKSSAVEMQLEIRAEALGENAFFALGFDRVIQQQHSERH